MQFITDFADEAVILPLCLAVAVWLVLSGWWRGALAWTLAITGMLGTMAMLKYIGFACPGPLVPIDIRSPSGHTAAASSVIGGGLAVLLRRSTPRPVVLLIPIAVAAIVGTTRVALGAHTVPEVLAGGLVGVACGWLFYGLAGPVPPLRSWSVAVIALVVIAPLHGVRLRAEGLIHHFPLFTWVPLPRACQAGPA